MRTRRIVIAVSFVCALAASPAHAQTADDLFNPDVLHRLDLLVNSRDWEKLKADFQSNEWYPADVRYNGVTGRNVGIRSRGLGSRSGTKPGLRVDFNRFTTDGTFLGLKSFVLDNLTQDPTGIRERVAMRLFARMGLPAPRESHVRLYVNNAYAGLYAVVEEPNKDFLKRVFGETTPGDTENDGYLFEYDYNTEWFFNYPGPDLDAYRTLFSPKTHEDASMSRLYGPLEAMFRAIEQAPDATWETTVSQYLDLTVFMRHVAVQAFLAQWDGILGYAGANNFYFYRFEQSDRSQFIAWDEDNAFRAIDYSVIEGHEPNVLMRRAMSIPSLRAAYFAALLETAASAMLPEGAGPEGAGWLEREVLAQRQLITSAMHEDPVKPFTSEEYETEMDAMVAFARGRDRQVRCEVARLNDPASVATACAGLSR